MEDFLAKVREEGKKDEAYERARKQEAAIDELSSKDQKVEGMEYKDDLLYRGNLLWIPKGLV